MSGPFAPGRVAIVTIDGQDYHALRDTSEAWLVGELEDERVFFDRDGLVTTIRQLFTLDLRSDRRVDSVVEALQAAGLTDVTEARVRTALRALMVRPSEPTGFGAVVLDAADDRWVRSHPEPKPWTRPDLSGTFAFDEIDAVDVLAMGVPA